MVLKLQPIAGNSSDEKSMSNIKLSRLSSGIATELQGSASDLKKLVQTLNERPPVHYPHSCKFEEITHA
jgi:hypothetical protein